ncbi:N-6 DNA methylase [Desulfococcaceae bacterium HSG8]|nr:N-6 DNA methylase [Desulfococcaceae bacterium HSG8]
MNIEELEGNIQSLITNLAEKTFIYDLLLAYGQPKASVTRLKKGDYNLSKNPGEILWKKKLFFKKETDSDLHNLIDRLKSDPAIVRHHPRFIIVTDFQTLLSVDTKTEDTLDIPVTDLPKHYDFFLPWAGMEKSQIQSENPADIKAAERMGRLYDLILEDNPLENEGDRHALNIFLSRLLFCFFAEDTGIFADGQFINSLASHTAEDGKDLQAYLQKFFKVLNSRERSDYPQFLQDFPYVNGGLFAEDYPVPMFSAKSGKIIIECGALNWKAINPDIFGSMMQAVVHNDRRSSMGMHYTSVVNIMKVIEPLFLNDLYAELERAGNSKKKLEKLLDRLSHLRIFDPACGSGNFLIIAYKELCKLEIEIFKRLSGKQLRFRFLSNIRLTQFYGIEIDDFAHETAKLSLWLAEHQMNLAFKEVFGETRPTLPLQDGGNIVCGNATRLDWEEVCPKDEGYEIYILGNPPYLGFSMQSKEQKEDLKLSWGGTTKLDYISIWFLKAGSYIKAGQSKFAFVSTNSINQGEQVALLWPHIFSKGLEINFGHTSFKWTNNAKGNAGVTCSVIGVAGIKNTKKVLYTDGVRRAVKSISAYLTAGSSNIITKRRDPISSIPFIVLGNMPKDGGHLILSTDEKEALISQHQEAAKFIRKFLGSREFIRGGERWCLWLEDSDVPEASKISEIKKRINDVAAMRLASPKKGTRKFAEQPHRFVEIRHQAENSIIIPRISSERREYIPIGFLDSNVVVSDLAYVIYTPATWLFAVISSRIHMTWVRTVAGRLETRIRYSSALCYNTFPFPEITKSQKNTLEDHVFKVLDEREQHSEKTMAQLYDPDKMPDGLRKAHHEMDIAVEQCYRKRPFENDEERMEYLFKLYEEMIQQDTK